MAATLLQRGILSTAFAVAALAGFSSPEAQAHGAHGHDTQGHSAPDTSRDTRATQVNASVFLAHYAARMKSGMQLGIIDHDRLEAFNSAPATSDVNTILLSNGAQLDDISMLYLRGALENKQSRGVYSVNDSAGLDLYHETQEAFAQPMVTSTDGTLMCVTVLGNPSIAVATIDGMTQAQVINFVNRHELRHCTDTSGLKDLVMLHNRWQELEKTEFGTRETETARYAYQAHILYRETISDLGALVDMIAIDNASPDIIDNVARWRQNEVHGNDDIVHYTTPSLTALSQHISSIGVETFRKMSEQEREKIIHDIAAGSRLSAGSFAHLTGHLTGANDTVLKPNVAVSDAERAAVMPLISRLEAHDHVGTVAMSSIILTDLQKQELVNWNAHDTLTRAALDHSGQVSRDSLHHARIQLLDNIRAGIAAHPSDPLHGAKLVLLENTFKKMMHDLDAPAPQRVQVSAQAQPAGPG